MPDIKTVFSEEVRRLARKEMKSAVLPLAKTIAEQRQTISELKKRIAALEKLSVAVKSTEVPAADVPADASKKLRLNAAGIARIRNKLKLTQGEFAKLLGVSIHTVSFWELGKVSPRQETKNAICELRTIGKRELKKRLNADSANA